MEVEIPLQTEVCMSFLSTRMKNDTIGMEDLQITNMERYTYLSKSILDASWGRLRQYISYKAENAGKLFVSVNHKGTTQRCSQCGNKVEKKLWNREHKCSCGFEAPRDYNSALEIKNLCLQKIGQELSDLKPVEISLTAELQKQVYELYIREAGSLLQNC